MTGVTACNREMHMKRRACPWNGQTTCMNEADRCFSTQLFPVVANQPKQRKTRQRRFDCTQHCFYQWQTSEAQHKQRHRIEVMHGGCIQHPFVSDLPSYRTDNHDGYPKLSMVQQPNPGRFCNTHIRVSVHEPPQRVSSPTALPCPQACPDRRTCRLPLATTQVKCIQHERTQRTSAEKNLLVYSYTRAHMGCMRPTPI